jgi:hypothetical protein
MEEEIDSKVVEEEKVRNESPKLTIGGFFKHGRHRKKKKKERKKKQRKREKRKGPTSKSLKMTGKFK